MNEVVSPADQQTFRLKALHRAFLAHQNYEEPGTSASAGAEAADDFRVRPDPYPGLRSFTPNESGIFFGRERNVDEVRSKLADLNFAVVLGGSGSGKSSLIRAGLMPRLNSTKGITGRFGNWYAADFRPRLNPLNEMGLALTKLVRSFFGSAQDPVLSNSASSQALADLSSARERVDNNGSTTDRVMQADELSDALIQFVDADLDRLDHEASQGLRAGRPSLMLVIDQFEEVFRPEVALNPAAGGRKFLDFLIATCAKLKQLHRSGKQSGLFIVITMRSEELHRCAEHPSIEVKLDGRLVVHSLADLVNSGMYLLDLLDPKQDREDLREAIVRPARRVFDDWGLPMDPENADAPFARGVVDWLLRGADRLSVELDHRPDQLPLLQHALQTIWRGAVQDWVSQKRIVGCEIRREHLPCALGRDLTSPDLAACLDWRADLMARDGRALFAQQDACSRDASEAALKRGDEMICAAFRALAQRDDRGNWARRFADWCLIESFLPRHDNVLDRSQEHQEAGLKAALSKFVGTGYLVLKDGYYDISHEALIRNWKRYQDWLRDPEEISQAVARAIAEINPASVESHTPAADDLLLSALSKPLCNTLNKIFQEKLLPRSWAKEQIAPLMNRQAIVNRWRTKDPNEALELLESLVKRAQTVRKRQARRRLWKSLAAVATAPVLVAAFFMWQTYQANKTTSIIRSKSIALHAEDALKYRGPVLALLIAMQTEKVGLPAIPETEQIMYKALRQLREKRTLSAPSVMNATVDPTGTMVVGLTPRGLIRFWRSADGQLIDTYQLEANGPSQTFGINWSPDGQRLAIGAGERTAILIPCSRPKLRPIFPACSSTDNDQLNWLGGSGVLAGPGKFSKDGRSFITGNWRSRARLWSLDSGSYTDLGVETAFPWAAALSPDMQKAVVGTSRGTVEIVDIKTRQIVELKLGEAEKSAVTSVDFGNDPNILVAATQSGNLWLLNLAKGISVQVTGQTGIAFQTAFSGDGKRIATTSDDGALRMWLVDNIKDEPFVLRGHERPTYSVHFTDDGSRLISASPDGTVRIWSVYGALHHEMKPMHQPNSVSESPTHFADDQEVARAQAGDYTVVAYSGPHRHLALFHTDHVSAELREQPAPTSEWADRIHVNWRAVGLKSPDPSKKDGKGTISAVATTGETYTWPYFTDIASLTRFADEALPSFDGRKAELPENERCKLDLVELANTSNAPTGRGIGACREAGE